MSSTSGTECQKPNPPGRPGRPGEGPPRDSPEPTPGPRALASHLAQAEEADYLGAILDDGKLPEGCVRVQPPHMADPCARVVLAELQRMAKAGEPLRWEALLDHLDGLQFWPGTDGPGVYVSELTIRHPTPQQVTHAAREIVRRWTDRETALAADRLALAIAAGDQEGADRERARLAELAPGAKREPGRKRKAAPIIIDVDLDRVVRESIAALASDPNLYIRAHQPVTVIPAEVGMDLGPEMVVEDPAARRNDADPPAEIRVPPGAPIIWPLDSGQIRRRLSVAAKFTAYDARAKEERPKPPPPWCAEMIVGDGRWPGWPRLRGIAGGPLLAPDGSLVTTPGYDPKTGFYLCDDLPAVDVPKRPAQRDVTAAVDTLLDLITDFRFIADRDRAAWVALILTLVGRPAILGPTPIVVFGANIRGAGKTLAVDMASIIATGTPAPSRSWPVQKEEREKVLVSLALRGIPLCNWDNVTSTIGGDPLDNWLTTTSPSGRILGVNKEVVFDWRTVLTCTVNNAELKDDTTRRAIHALQQVDEEYPESRTGFRHPNIKAHALAHRGEYLSAVLTILRAHALAGWPSASGRPKGSFEAWCRVVRDALIHAGLPDVEREPDDPSVPASQERLALGALLEALRDIFGEDLVSVAEIMDRAYPTEGEGNRPLRDALEEVVTSKRVGRPERRAIGQALRRCRNRPCDGLVLRAAGRGGHSKAQTWRILPVNAGNAGNESHPDAKICQNRSSESADTFSGGAGFVAADARNARSGPVPSSLWEEGEL